LGGKGVAVHALEITPDHFARNGAAEHHETEHGDGAELALFLQVEDHDRHHLGRRREQDDRGRQLADDADEDEAPRSDDAALGQGAVMSRRYQTTLPSFFAASTRASCANAGRADRTRVNASTLRTPQLFLILLGG